MRSRGIMINFRVDSLCATRFAAPVARLALVALIAAVSMLIPTDSTRSADAQTAAIPLARTPFDTFEVLSKTGPETGYFVPGTEAAIKVNLQSFLIRSVPSINSRGTVAFV